VSISSRNSSSDVPRAGALAAAAAWVTKDGRVAERRHDRLNCTPFAHVSGVAFEWMCCRADHVVVLTACDRRLALVAGSVTWR
jgi:hypothetical protein